VNRFIIRQHFISYRSFNYHVFIQPLNYAIQLLLLIYIDDTSPILL